MSKKVIVSFLVPFVMFQAFAYAYYEGGQEKGSDIWSWSSGQNSENDSNDGGINMQLAKSLKGVFDKTKKDLLVVEKLLLQKQYSEALRQSKDLLDQIKLKAGVNPKAMFREKIIVKGIFKKGLHNGLKSKFGSLGSDRKEALAIAVFNHRGGLYLDLLNLYKQTNLIYLKAFYYQIKTVSTLRLKDLEKLKTDLLLIHDIPILIKDKNLKSSFMLFDSQVADVDQQYFFNRELVDFAISIKELKLTDKIFEKELAANKQLMLENHWAGVVYEVSDEEKRQAKEKKRQAKEEKLKEMEKVRSDYRNCNNAADNYYGYSERADAFIECFEEYYKVLDLSIKDCSWAAWEHHGEEDQAIAESWCAFLIKNK